MIRFAFVILHYNSLTDTQACIESISIKCKMHSYRIYVVDNASPNNSGIILKNAYNSDPNISVILNPTNEGFAKGNNIGITKALEDGFSDFVIVLNSDTKILQNNFCDLIQSVFDKSSFAVLGPTILTPKGDLFINPFGDHIIGNTELKKIKRFYSLGYFLVKTNHDKIWSFYVQIRQFKNRVKGKIIRILKKIPKGHFFTENCVLHGCCLIFSKKFFEKFKGFDPRTFLYLEEHILYAHVIKSGLKTVYDPDVLIWHKEDGATDSIYQKSKEKKLFIYTNMIKSLNVYNEVLKEYGII